MLRIKNLNVPFNNKVTLSEIVAKHLKISKKYIKDVHIVRKAIDARRFKNAPIYYVYTLDIIFTDDFNARKLHYLRRDKHIEFLANSLQVKPITSSSYKKSVKPQPIVVGFGPAGIFCALTLCQYGYQPLILERGCDVDKRCTDIKTFWNDGKFNPVSNIQFGEGGAGTFSDGKLTTRISDPKIQTILQTFVAAGAPPEILYLHKPHVGTDILRTVVKNIRQQLLAAGATIRFLEQLIDINIVDNQISSIFTTNSDEFPCKALFLGIGHSARDTYEMLWKNNIAMAAKPFAIGIRIEHPQSLIDSSQYGTDGGHPLLPVSDYALTWHNREKDLSCYSFCMCPGGIVVAAASEEGRLTTNGMSNYARDSGIANSALLSPVTPADFGNDVLAGIAFQRHYEEKAFLAGGSNYYAPVQSVGDFLKHTHGCSEFLTEPTYKPGVTLADLHELLPEKVAASIEGALPYFEHKITDFSNPAAVMTGLEMRSSAPCRILRNRNDYTSINTKGLYPIGEGAGYAGGIMSAAVDGMNAALSYISQNKNN